MFSELCYATSNVLYMFPAVLFITSGDWVKVSILLYFVTLSYDMIEFLVVHLSWYLYSALPSFPHFGSHL